MKQLEDDRTIDLVGVIKHKPGRKKIYASPAEKQAAYRARLGTKSMAVQLEPDVLAAVHAYMARASSDGDAPTISQVISKLLRTQLLRKR